MVKLSVMYPNQEGTNLDMTYYCNRHIPMVRQLLGSTLKGVSVEQGISGEEAGSPAPYLAMGHLLFDSLEAFRRPSARMHRQSLVTSQITRTRSRSFRSAK